MATLKVAIAISCIVFVPCVLRGEQQYAQYVDGETGIIKKPLKLPEWTDPYGDGVWRSAWFYSAIIQLRAAKPDIYAELVKTNGVSVDNAKQFLSYFASNCIDGDEWSLPKNPTQKFSRDQLAPLLLLLAVVNKYEPTMRDDAKLVVKRLCKIVNEKGALSDSPQGKINPNLKYAIDVVARKYDVNFLDGNSRYVCKLAFGAQLKLDSGMVQLPVEAWSTQDGFSVFNRLGLVTMQAVVWGTDDSDVKTWRSNYKQHADKGWGPSFKIVSGRSITRNEVDEYKKAFILRSQDNDIVMAQRPEKYIKEQFPGPQLQQGPDGAYLVLDYLILEGLLAAWE